MPFSPVAIFGLEVHPGDVLIPVVTTANADIRITMAAIDPTEEIEEDDQAPRRPRSTLKLIKERRDDDEEGSEVDDDYLQALLNGEADESDEDSDDEEANGGPSDPSKSKKALRAAALQELLDATKNEDSDEEMEDDDSNAKKSAKKVNGKKAPVKSKGGKGKEKAVEPESDEEDSEEDEESDEDEDGIQSMNLQPFAICTLDTEAHYQQPLDLTITASERAFFVNSGTHTIYVTGNYVVHDDDLRDDSDDEEDSDDDEYDLPPDMEDLIGDDSEDDELDNIDGAGRIEEVETDEEEAPKLVATKKGKNKRAAEADGLDELIAQESKGEEAKLSKKQAKKLKTNEGKAVPAEKETPKSEKKVQFAKNLELGPTGSPAPTDSKKQAAKKAPSVRTEKGVTIDDRKVGTGRTAKAGDRVGMRYIGKLENGKVFDANKKGPPFSFKLGKGEVIEGWDIGVKGMAIGGERRLTVPASKAYGSKSLPGIPANSTLIFDVKLLEIK